ncbi:hypothetical protein PR003_g3493 [Phytophthora rubi]|uniref:Uncharacterized protein n=1 Tax=Phytophthora rubi TaxID=129364 RepID=A0A6A3P9B0_9STRA|nr:hypothetical protein PR002_g893 [Phytophthora rubi]KAE9049327.1 hypothetical protein PR001_g3415 [Phytophthora rubi]KAE9354171.1 hypothetical protein PR003_g3493 [Phytophthora rubi]
MLKAPSCFPLSALPAFFGGLHNGPLVHSFALHVTFCSRRRSVHPSCVVPPASANVVAFLH